MPDMDMGRALSMKRAVNRLRRTIGVVTGMSGFEGNPDAYFVLQPAPADESEQHPSDYTDWVLAPGNEEKGTGDPSHRFLFRTEAEARRVASAIQGATVEGPLPVLPPFPPGSDKVVKVVVHYSSNRKDEYPGDQYDSVFWGDAARDKFLVPYASTLGLTYTASLTSDGSVGHERWSKTSRP